MKIEDYRVKCFRVKKERVWGSKIRNKVLWIINRAAGKGVGLIPEGVSVGENISLMRFLRRGSTTEVLNRVLDTALIETNNPWRRRKRERGRQGVNRDCDLYSGGKFLGDTYDILPDYVRFSHVVQNGVKVPDWKND